MEQQIPSTAERQRAMDHFERELGLVHDEMTLALEALGSPLGELVEARMNRHGRPTRAALILATGFSISESGLRKRVQLAAALEMLHIALDIHHQLVDPADLSANGSAEDRTVVGSTILAGDFCFSRAAQMAANTENPTIVGIFAQALQGVSEHRLRELHAVQLSSSTDPRSDRDAILLQAGADAAIELSDLPDEDIPALRELSNRAVATAASVNSLSFSLDEWATRLPRRHAHRWQAFYEWTSAEG